MQRILVPVDGSELSERALPYAALLAKAQGAKVLLVRVLEPLVWTNPGEEGYTDPATYDYVVNAIRSDALDHLSRNRDVLEGQGIATETELLEGLAASALLDYEANVAPDLCIIATHGRSGLARFALGSIADRLMRDGSAPILLIPAFAEGDARLDHALVPLDGSPVAEQALPIVEALACGPLSRVTLLTALDEASEPVPAADAPTLMATAYLQQVAARLAESGVPSEVSVVSNDAAEAIEAAASQVDVVIMSTHGRGGLDRIRHGSVADRATHSLPIPRLLVRAQLEPNTESKLPAASVPRTDLSSNPSSV